MKRKRGRKPNVLKTVQKTKFVFKDPNSINQDRFKAKVKSLENQGYVLTKVLKNKYFYSLK